MKHFEYIKAKTVEEACSLLSKHKGEAKLLAGGTEAIVRMKQRVESPQYLIDLKEISGLDTIETDKDGALRIGSLATIKTIETSSVIKEKFGVLAQAASKVASSQLRNRGTIGGNIYLDSRCPYFNQSYHWKKSLPLCFKAGGDVCHVAKGGKICFAVCSADTVPALIALGAKVKMVSSKAEKTILLEDFYHKDGDGLAINASGADEIITQVEIPALPAHSGGVYLKVSQRKAVDFPIVGVAALVELNGNKQCRDAKIVIGAVSPRPTRANEAEEALRGKEIEDGLVQQASELALKAIRHLSNGGGHAWYRRRVVPVIVGRAVKQAAEAAEAR
jgi:4-hydroxybenzoyl-CoA reductase subunit beta